MSNEKALELINILKSKSVTDPDTGCWLWNEFKTKKGYGRYRYGNTIVSVHRLSAFIFLFLDYYDKTQHALHRPNCPNKHCWNPDHLYVGTNQDNMNDKVIAGNARGGPGKKPQTHCIKGHELNENNVYRSKDGKRMCKICKLEYSKKRYEMSKR